MNTAEKLSKLRALMEQHNIDYYYVPSTDQHDNEYLPKCWERRQWITDFTGSAGDALIGKNQAYLWTDPRYFLQAEQQLDANYFTLMRQQQGMAAPIHQWFAQNGKQKKVGVDPSLLKLGLTERWQQALHAAGGELIALNHNLIDQAWADQPQRASHPITLLDTQYTGLDRSTKLNNLRATWETTGADCEVISMLDAIAWLFNLRGKDINYNPLAIAYAIVTQQDATLFIDTTAVSPEQQKTLAQDNIHIKAYEDFSGALNTLTGKVLIDPNSASWWVQQQLTQAKQIIQTSSAITMMKAIKNKTEQAGMREAHRVDALAMCRFLAWLELNWRGQSELSTADKLEAFRREHPDCQGLSFNTISGMAEHGAIIHYAVSQETDKAISDDNLYLVDSGGQYWQGTTDITRTVHLGTPTEQQKLHYTLVLKGHIALRHTHFPHGTNGEHLNAIAHWPLWQRGLDFGHGVGHGVGCYLCVHEGPQRISGALTGVNLLPGMVVSNEPGFYLEGQYGIRIENLVLIEQSITAKESLSGHGPFYTFDDLTLVPYERKLIDTSLLNKEEVQWINSYHKCIFDRLHSDLDEQTQAWLRLATTDL